MNTLDLRHELELDYSTSSKRNAMFLIIAISLFIIAGFAYIYWLNTSCPGTAVGAMTWHGKVCIQ